MNVSHLYTLKSMATTLHFVVGCFGVCISLTKKLYSYTVNEVQLISNIGLKILKQLLIGLLANIMYSNRELLKMPRHYWVKGLLIVY